MLQRQTWGQLTALPWHAAQDWGDRLMVTPPNRVNLSLYCRAGSLSRAVAKASDLAPSHPVRVPDPGRTSIVLATPMSPTSPFDVAYATSNGDVVIFRRSVIRRCDGGSVRGAEELSEPRCKWEARAGLPAAPGGVTRSLVGSGVAGKGETITTIFPGSPELG